ncbi:MAG: hypothetical protein ACO3JL_05895 [Myxococcota bacterium]
MVESIRAGASELTVWSFRDEEGRHHVALPLLQVERGEVRFTLAIAEGSGLVALRHDGDQLVPERDETVVSQLQEDLAALASDRASPTVVFEANDERGHPVTYRALRMVAHRGESFVVAEGPDGVRAVFSAATSPGEAPRRVTKAAQVAILLDLARGGIDDDGRARPERELPPPRVLLHLADGQQRTLETVREVAAGDHRYLIAVDPTDRTTVVLLRREPAGVLTPVEDDDEVERVRRSMLGG